MAEKHKIINRKYNYWESQQRLSDYFESQSEAEIHLREFA